MIAELGLAKKSKPNPTVKRDGPTPEISLLNFVGAFFPLPPTHGHDLRLVCQTPVLLLHCVAHDKRNDEQGAAWPLALDRSVEYSTCTDWNHERLRRLDAEAAVMASESGVFPPAKGTVRTAINDSAHSPAQGTVDSDRRLGRCGGHSSPASNN